MLFLQWGKLTLDLEKALQTCLNWQGIGMWQGSSSSIPYNNEKGGNEGCWKPSVRISRVSFPHQIHCPRWSRVCVEKSWISTLKRVSIFFLNYVLFFYWDIYFQLNNWGLMNLLPFFRSSRNFISPWLQRFRRFGMLSGSCLLSPKFFFQALFGRLKPLTKVSLG